MVLVGVLLSLAGCHRKEAATDATKPLAQSFDGARPDVKQAIEAVNARLRSRDYVGAIRTLTPVVENAGKLTEQQKQAAGTALRQVNEALATNPALDTKELYEERRKLAKALNPGLRF
jgi:hypothetical protein